MMEKLSPDILIEAYGLQLDEASRTGSKEDLGSGTRNILRYAPLYYPGYKIEINSGQQFVFSITYQDENVTVDEKMSPSSGKNVTVDKKCHHLRVKMSLRRLKCPRQMSKGKRKCPRMFQS